MLMDKLKLFRKRKKGVDKRVKALEKLKEIRSELVAVRKAL